MDEKTLRQHAANAEEYERKRVQIEAARAFLEQMENENEVARAKYEAELLKKVREGDEARQRLLELGRPRNFRVNGPPPIEAPSNMARIEELPMTSSQPRGDQRTSVSASSQATFQSQFLVTPPVQPPPSLPRVYGQQLASRQHSQHYPTAQFRPQAPPPQAPATVSRIPDRVQQGGQPTYHHQMRPTNQQVNGLQKPAPHQTSSATPRGMSSSKPIPVPSQGPGNNVPGPSVVSQLPANGIGNGYQHPVHYKPTGVQSVGTSSLTGALGPQAAQPSVPPSLATSTSSPTVPEKAAQPPPPQPPTTSASQLPDAQPSEDELEDRRLKILGFRSSILDWARSTQPNTYTEFFNLKLCKAPNSALFITSVVKGQEIVEHQEAFFERLWLNAGLPADNIPFKQGPTVGPSGLDKNAGPLTPLPAPSTSIQSVPVQQATGRQSSASTTLPTRIPPQTPRRRTLVDGVAGTWRSPADADLKRLAKDVIHALGNRKLDSVTQSSPNENPSKRQAFEVPSTSVGNHRATEPIIINWTPPNEQVVTITGHKIQDSVVEPSAQPVEQPPAPLTIVSVAPPNPQPLESNPPAPSNIKELPSGSSPQNVAVGQNPPQVAGQSESLLSKGIATTPSQTLPNLSPQPATPVTIAVPNTAILPERVGVDASSSGFPGATVNNKTHDPVQPLADPAPPIPPADSQMDSHSPSSVQVLPNEQVPSSSKSIDVTSVDARPSASDFSREVSTPTPREPLFLPSPSPSPSPSPLPSKKKKRLSVYVLVPPPPEYLIRYRKQQSMKDGSDSRKDSIPRSSVVSTSRTSRLLEDFSWPAESEHDIDPHEQEAVQLSCSRLQSMPCRWGECGIKLNSVETLIQHLNTEHKPAGISFSCRWTQCGRQCRPHEKHLERHATMTLQCAYQGCEESYRTGGQLLKHFRAKHPNSTLNVQAKPSVHRPQPPPPLPEGILPCHLIVPPPALPATISPERHSILEPLVMRHVIGFDGDRQRRTKKFNGTDSTSEATTNTYEFLNKRSTRYSWRHSRPVNMNFDDLDSEEISKECDQGLTLFGTENRGDEEVPLPDEESLVLGCSSPPKPNGDVNDVDYPAEIVSNTVNTTEPASEDEKMVQNLLIE